MASIFSTPHSEKCPQCGSGLVHLEWRERVNAQEIQDLWRCFSCKSEFVTAATSDEREPSVVEITKPFFTSLLV
jgi:DNA-directed RNA polymerase subunit RPC12/RpoP